MTSNRSGEPNKLFPPSGCFFALHPEDLDQGSGQVLGRLCLRCENPSLPELRSHLFPVSISLRSHFHIRGIRRGVFPQHDSEFDIDDNGRRRNKTRSCAASFLPRSQGISRLWKGSRGNSGKVPHQHLCGHPPENAPEAENRDFQPSEYTCHKRKGETLVSRRLSTRGAFCVS